VLKASKESGARAAAAGARGGGGAAVRGGGAAGDTAGLLRHVEVACKQLAAALAAPEAQHGASQGPNDPAAQAWKLAPLLPTLEALRERLLRFVMAQAEADSGGGGSDAPVAAAAAAAACEGPAAGGASQQEAPDATGAAAAAAADSDSADAGATDAGATKPGATDPGAAEPGAADAASAAAAANADAAAAARLFSGAAAATAPGARGTQELAWWYLDCSGALRGPYTPSTMLRWWCQGFLEADLPLAAVAEAPDGAVPRPAGRLVPLRVLLDVVAAGGSFEAEDPAWAPAGGSGTGGVSAALRDAPAGGGASGGAPGDGGGAAAARRGGLLGSLVSALGGASPRGGPVGAGAGGRGGGSPEKQAPPPRGPDQGSPLQRAGAAAATAAPPAPPRWGAPPQPSPRRARRARARPWAEEIELDTLPPSPQRGGGGAGGASCLSAGSGMHPLGPAEHHPLADGGADGAVNGGESTAAAVAAARHAAAPAQGLRLRVSSCGGAADDSAPAAVIPCLQDTGALDALPSSALAGGATPRGSPARLLAWRGGGAAGAGAPVAAAAQGGGGRGVLAAAAKIGGSLHEALRSLSPT
jgi:hypothetical protein